MSDLIIVALYVGSYTAAIDCTMLVNIICFSYRTDIFNGSSQNGTVSTRSYRSAGAYSILNRETRDSPLQFQGDIVLNHIHSDSSEKLISSEGTDASIHSLSKTKMPTNYEIPFSSQENLTSSGLDSTPNFQVTSQHTSGTSGYSSNNPVQTTVASNSHTDDSASATNPRYVSNDYEDTLSPNSMSSVSDSPSPGGVHMLGSKPSGATVAASLQQIHKVSGNRSPSGSTGSSSPHVMKQALMEQFQSTDNVTTTKGCESNYDEAPPHYSSRRSSEQILDSDSDNSSMIQNGVYEQTDRHHQPWYHSEISADSSSAHLRHPPSPGTIAASERIHPYAMIHNEHIPYHPPNYNSSSDQSNAPISRHSRDQLGSGLLSSVGITTSSTLC